MGKVIVDMSMSLDGFITGPNDSIQLPLGKNGERLNEPKGHYASVNNLNLYYEIHGTGNPLVLLPGGFMTIEAIGHVLAPLSSSRQVIAVELQGHGHTVDFDRPLSFQLMADDIAALLKHLGIARSDIFGFSLGGGVALQTAIRQPELVRKLVLVSTPYRRQGWYPEVLAGMASMNAETVRIAPPSFVAKMRQLLSQEYDWTHDVAAMKVPTLIIIGDADSVRTVHAVEMFNLLSGGKADGAMNGLPNSQLAILPGTTHFTILSRTDLLLPIITPFLDTPLSTSD